MYLVEVGGKPRGPLTGYQVLKLFDGGKIRRDTRICLASDPDRFDGPSCRLFGESVLFTILDHLRAAVAIGPRRWKYKMVQIPPTIVIGEGMATKGIAATYLERIVEEYAELGWEFYRVDTIGVRVYPGCLAGLFGVRPTDESYYVVTFRAQMSAEAEA